MRFEFTFTGTRLLILHHNNIEGRDEVSEFIAGKKKEGIKGKAGDDRFPAWTWHTYLYRHDGQVVLPYDNVMSALLYAGAKVPHEAGGSKTYKELSQSGLLIEEEAFTVLVDGKPIALADVDKLRELPFAEQKKRVEKLGFELFIKPVSVGKSSHVRVRPIFPEWSITGHIEIISPDISELALRSILELAGRRAGLGDWRPGAKPGKTPGPYGTFGVKLRRA